MYHNFTIHTDTSLTINSLHTNASYYITIEAFNENGVTTSTEIIEAK
jgi:hypothetical protein